MHMHRSLQDLFFLQLVYITHSDKVKNIFSKSEIFNLQMYQILFCGSKLWSGAVYLL